MDAASVGSMIRDARATHGLSLQQVAARAGCSSGYVHKLETDRVRTPSPRVLARLAVALGLAYGELMQAADYEQLPGSLTGPATPGAVQRYSNAHIVLLLEALQRDVVELKALLQKEERLSTRGGES